MPLLTSAVDAVLSLLVLESKIAGYAVTVKRYTQATKFPVKRKSKGDFSSK